MARKPRKEIQELIDELKSWLPNYARTPESFPTLLWRMLASLPGGDEAEDIGYEPFEQIGWKEAELLGNTLETIQDKRDVEDLVAGLLEDEEGDEDDEGYEDDEDN